MSIWEFNSAVDGWVKAHSPDDKSLSAAEQDDIWSWMQVKEGLVH